MKRAKPKHVETRVWECLPGSWDFGILYRNASGRRACYTPQIDHPGYTRRSDAKRGAARAWARIQRGAK